MIREGSAAGLSANRRFDQRMNSSERGSYSGGWKKPILRLEISELPPSRKIQIEGNTPHEIFAHLRQSARRSESEIIKIQIITGRMIGTNSRSPRTPLVAPDIEETVGYARKTGRSACRSPPTKSRPHHAVPCRRKLAQRLREGLPASSAVPVCVKEVFPMPAPSTSLQE